MIDKSNAAQRRRSQEVSQSDSTEVLETIGNRVHTIRARKGLSRKVLSQLSGVSERHLAQLESGTGNISILLLHRIAEAIGVPLQELLAESKPPAIDDAMLVSLVRQATPAQREQLISMLTPGIPGGAAAARGQRIALLGLRGAGKSTLGGLVAGDLGLPFVELNDEIESDSGLAVSEIFSLYGQTGYRRLEHQCLRVMIKRYEKVLLAPAGGIVAQPETFEMLLRSFHTVWLRAHPEEHMARVRAQGDKRPMAGDPAAMEELLTILKSREPLYARSDITFDTAGRSVAQCRRELTQKLSDWL